MSVAALKAQTAAMLKRRAGAKREIRFRDLVEPALEGKMLRHNQASSIRTDRMRLRRVLPAIGRLPLSKLIPKRLERFLQDLARGDEAHRPVAGATINRFHSLLSTICQHAVRQGLLQTNPMRSVPHARESAINVRYLSSDERRRLLDVIRADCPAKVLEFELAVRTGMRRGEQYNARWTDWKPREGVLYVTGKTGPRPVQISRAAAKCLRSLRRRAPRDQAFITPERNCEERDCRTWFRDAVKKAGFGSPFRYHDLRHTFASRLAIAGVPLLEIQQLLGHKKIDMTLRYAHLSPDRRRKAVERLRF